MTHVHQVEKTEISIDWLTTMAIAAVAICLTQFIHEGMHALTCIVVGSDLQEFSAIHVSCQSGTVLQSKFVSGSASIVNLIVGTIMLVMIRRPRQRAPQLVFFLWLFMLMNWLLGSGYWAFSGIGNIGDWANVINGWEPHWLWRIIMATVGLGVYMYSIWLALHELGKIIGGDDPSKQVRGAIKLGLISYIAVVFVIFLSALFNPYGILGLPAVAAMLLALGGMFPLIWMMQWFRANSFVKLQKEPLEINRQWTWVGSAVAMVIVYSVILGRTIYF